MAFLLGAGVGPSVTVSGLITLSRVTPQAASTSLLRLVRISAAGGTYTVSSSTVRVYNFSLTGTTQIVRTEAAGGTATLSGTLIFRYCSFDADTTVCNPNVSGGTVVGPSSVSFEHSEFSSTLTTSSGSGTLTWSAATLKFTHCRCLDLFTFVGTNFSTVEAFETVFNGDSGDESVAASGTRPTTYRFWKCTFNGRYDDLLPEVIDDYAVRGAAGALSAGNLLTINSSGNAAAAGAGSVVEGICLDAVAASGDRTIMVRRGQIFVDSHATVVAGDSCVLDAAGTPTSQILGAAVVGQRTGRALEATGTTRSGEAYTVVNLM
jgi:hypothetical protein